MVFLHKVWPYDLLLHDSPKCHWSTLCHMTQARSGLCMYRVLLTAVCACGHASMVTCAQCFFFGSRSSRNLFYFTRLFALCTDFAMFRFASLIFCWTLYSTFWPRVCSVLVLLFSRFLTVWVSFQVAVSTSSSSVFFLSVILLLCLYSVVSVYVVFVVSMLFLCFRLMSLYMWFLESFVVVYGFVVFSEFDCYWKSHLFIIETKSVLFVEAHARPGKVKL